MAFGLVRLGYTVVNLPKFQNSSDKAESPVPISQLGMQIKFPDWCLPIII